MEPGPEVTSIIRQLSSTEALAGPVLVPKGLDGADRPQASPEPNTAGVEALGVPLPGAASLGHPQLCNLTGISCAGKTVRDQVLL